MGLQTGTHTSKTYLSIVNGKLAQKSTEGAPKAVSRKNKKDEIVWEVHHDSLSGIIKEMKVENKVLPSGKTKQLEITMTDIGESFILTIQVESKMFDHFCSKIGSADLSKTIEIKPYSFIPKGEAKKKSGLNLYQNGVKLGYFFSPENHQGKPFPPAETMNEDAYKVFKIQERKFYCDYLMGMTSPVVATKASPVLPAGVDPLPF